MTEQQAWALVVVLGFAALGIPSSLKWGLAAIAEALDGIRRELHDYNEARRSADKLQALADARKAKS